MWNASCDLPDVSLWLPLADAGHAQHARARKYWEEEASGRIRFCRITMLGLLRLATNPAAMGGRPFTPSEAWNAYRILRGLPEVEFVEEPAGLEAQMAAWSDSPGFPVSGWTDCYLAAMSVMTASRLVTFDRGFRRFTGLSCLILES
jgi:uncharacterized protein